MEDAPPLDTTFAAARVKQLVNNRIDLAQIKMFYRAIQNIELSIALEDRLRKDSRSDLHSVRLYVIIKTSSPLTTFQS